MTSSPGSVSYRPLPKSYKGCYPFRLSAPSFIYPDTWSENARLLGPYVDEVELLFFESQSKDCLPSMDEIDELRRISKDFSLEYNIHLPTDVSIAASDTAEQEKAIVSLLKMIDLTRGLNPTSLTLHIPCDASRRTGIEMESWQGRAREGLEEIISSGIQPRQLAIENLDYPFGRVWDLIQELNMSACMDVGHLLLRGEDIASFYQEKAGRVAILHFHGVRDGKDHLPLTALSEPDSMEAVSILKKFSGTLSLEVFSYDRLAASMEWLEKMMR